MSNLPGEKILLTVNEAAACLGIGRSHLYGLIFRGDLRSVKIGRSRRIPLYALQEFVERLNEDAHEI